MQPVAGWGGFKADSAAMDRAIVMRRKLYRIGIMAGASLLLAACAGVPAPPETARAPGPRDPDFCVQEKQGFTAAVQMLQAGADGGVDRAPSEDLPHLASRIAGESDRIVQAIDRLSGSLAALKACRAMAAQKAGSSTAGTQASLEAMTPAEVDAAKAVLGPLARREAALRTAVEQAAANSALKDFASQNPAGRLEQPYIALNTAAIHIKPANDAPVLAQLRKGQRVLNVPDADAPPGWVHLALNDGTSGYVEAPSLKPVQPNPVAVQAMVRRQQRAIGQDPVMAALFATREVLPRKREALSDLIARTLSGTAGSLAFNETSERTLSR